MIPGSSHLGGNRRAVLILPRYEMLVPKSQKANSQLAKYQVLNTKYYLFNCQRSSEPKATRPQPALNREATLNYIYLIT